MIIRKNVYIILLINVSVLAIEAGSNRSWRQLETPRRRTLHELLMRNRNVASLPNSEYSPKVEEKRQIRSKQLQRNAQKTTIPREFSSNDVSKLVTETEIGDTVSGYNGPDTFGRAPSYADPSFLAAVMSQAEKANFRYSRTGQKTKKLEGNRMDADKINIPLRNIGHSKGTISDKNGDSKNEEFTPMIIVGYASVGSNANNSTPVKKVERRKPVFRPAKRRQNNTENKKLIVTPSIATNKGNYIKNVKRIRPHFPKRLPPVRSTDNVNNIVVRPTILKRKRPDVEVERPTILKKKRPDMEVVRPTIVKRKRPDVEVVRPTILKRKRPDVEVKRSTINTSLNLQTTTEKIFTNYIPTTYKPKISYFKPTSTKRNNVIEEKSDDVNSILYNDLSNSNPFEPVTVKQNNRIVNSNNLKSIKNFTPSKSDPFVHNKKIPPFLHTPKEEIKKTTYYNPLVLPPVTNSYTTLPPLRRKNEYNSNRFQNSKGSSSPHSQNEAFSSPFISDRVRVQRRPIFSPKFYPDFHVDPISYGPPHSNRRVFHKIPPYPTIRVPFRSPPIERRRKRKPSIFNAWNLFSNRRGETQELYDFPSTNFNGNDNVTYILSHGKTPKNGKRVMVVGPFTRPPLGAPKIHKLGSKQLPSKNNYLIKSTENTKERSNKLDFKDEKFPIFINHKGVEFRSSLRRRTPNKEVKKKNKYDVKKDYRKFYAHHKINYNVSPLNRHSKVSEADKERIIAAKVYFPKTESIRRSEIKGNFIPLPVPALNDDGEQIFRVKNIALPSLPSLTNRRRIFSRRKIPIYTQPLYNRDKNIKFSIPHKKPPYTAYRTTGSSDQYGGWQVINNDKTAANINSNIIQSYPKVNYKKDNENKMRRSNEVIIGRPLPNPKMVRYSSTLNVETPRVVKNIHMQKPHLL